MSAGCGRRGFPRSRRSISSTFSFQLRSTGSYSANSILAFVERTDNLILLGPPGTGKTMLAVGIKEFRTERGLIPKFFGAKMYERNRMLFTEADQFA